MASLAHGITANNIAFTVAGGAQHGINSQALRGFNTHIPPNTHVEVRTDCEQFVLSDSGLEVEVHDSPSRIAPYDGVFVTAQGTSSCEALGSVLAHCDALKRSRMYWGVPLFQDKREAPGSIRMTIEELARGEISQISGRRWRKILKKLEDLGFNDTRYLFGDIADKLLFPGRGRRFETLLRHRGRAIFPLHFALMVEKEDAQINRDEVLAGLPLAVQSALRYFDIDLILRSIPVVTLGTQKFRETQQYYIELLGVLDSFNKVARARDLIAFSKRIESKGQITGHIPTKFVAGALRMMAAQDLLEAAHWREADEQKELAQSARDAYEIALNPMRENKVRAYAPDLINALSAYGMVMHAAISGYFNLPEKTMAR